ncbi:hypothetical protein EDD17DRAFT_1546736 [Pisolithus thermaeus]|nr:hypothetical protein EDD17DRAFT_1546736 [Pisolithus thermaeus]
MLVFLLCFSVGTLRQFSGSRYARLLYSSQVSPPLRWRFRWKEWRLNDIILVSPTPSSGNATCVQYFIQKMHE